MLQRHARQQTLGKLTEMKKVRAASYITAIGKRKAAKLLESRAMKQAEVTAAPRTHPMVT